MRTGYYKRIFEAYLNKEKSHLAFWHGEPSVNENAFKEGSDEYYQKFYNKATYDCSLDDKGIPMLDYKGSIGLRYNPIAIAQYGLGNFNLYRGNTSMKKGLVNAIKAADWLVDNLQKNKNGLFMWAHEFDWEYFNILRGPWYSGLAQGQGISLLTRIYAQTRFEKYLEASQKAFVAMKTKMEDGGTLFIDDHGYWWIEEYLTDPPTHILNGFLWGLWGVYDLWKLTGDPDAEVLWINGVKTLADNAYSFDSGYWSLYDLAPLPMKNVCSFFYHKLHIVQLEVMFRLTGVDVFRELSEKWKGYLRKRWNTARAAAQKIFFKITYY